jgi:putative iron-only hydrogenase system regulator
MTGRDKRVAILAVVVSDANSVNDLNRILHDYSGHIIGRMGLPHGAKGINLISVALDAPLDVINSLAGKIGRLPGVSAKSAYSNVATVMEENADSDRQAGKGQDAPQGGFGRPYRRQRPRVRGVPGREGPRGS